MEDDHPSLDAAVELLKRRRKTSLRRRKRNQRDQNKGQSDGEEDEDSVVEDEDEDEDTGAERVSYELDVLNVRYGRSADGVRTALDRLGQRQTPEDKDKLDVKVSQNLFCRSRLSNATVPS